MGELDGEVSEDMLPERVKEREGDAVLDPGRGIDVGDKSGCLTKEGDFDGIDMNALIEGIDDAE